MKNRNLIKKNYLSKIKELNSHNRNYYEKSSPKISDAEYDDLKKEIIELEKTDPGPAMSDSKAGKED